jgi:hypothetical protein
MQMSVQGILPHARAKRARGEWIEPSSSGKILNVESMVLGHQTFHVFSSFL